MAFNKLLFGTAGIPISTQKPSTISGLGRVSELGLGGMELEFVHSVNVSKEKAPEVKAAVEKLNLALSCHGSYYINLNAVEKEKQDASIQRVLDAAKRADECSAFSMTFHPAFYLKDSPSQTMKNVLNQMKKIVEELKNEERKISVRPETTGKPTQFGSLDELIELSAQLDKVYPCIDFSHLHARSNGKINSYDEFRSALEKSEKVLGKTFLKNLHCHVSGIAYSEKGEKNHLILKESDFKYEELLKALKDYDCAGLIICESPNIEEDALLLKKTYEGL